MHINNCSTELSQIVSRRHDNLLLTAISTPPPLVITSRVLQRSHRKILYRGKSPSSASITLVDNHVSVSIIISYLQRETLRINKSNLVLIPRIF